MISEDVVFNFAGSSIASIWALELLLVLKGPPARSWTGDELIKQLRGSQSAIAEALFQLQSSGLIAEDGGAYYYRPSSPEQNDLVCELERLYRAKPVALISAIANAPTRKLQILSDAFRIKKD
jgi:hypothetical protein